MPINGRCLKLIRSRIPLILLIIFRSLEFFSTESVSLTFLPPENEPEMKGTARDLHSSKNLIHTFIIGNLMSAYYVPHPELGTEDRAVNNTDKNPHRTYIFENCIHIEKIANNFSSSPIL